jgi:hypothetical protein
MSLESMVFIVLILTTFYNNGVQAYIHLEAYPLIPLVGKSEFAAYLNEYERRINGVLVIPYGITVLSNLALIFLHPASLSVIWVIIALLLNLAVSIVTLRLATPVYNRIKQNGQANASDMGELMRINLYRLGLSTASSVVVIIMLLAVLP